MKLARFMAKYFMSVPILHTTWGEYLKIHARDHHGYPTICTDEDPDQQFVIEHGFKARMTEREFWFAWLSHLKPKHVWAHFAFRLRQNFAGLKKRHAFFSGSFCLLLSLTLASGLTLLSITCFLIHTHTSLLTFSTYRNTFGFLRHAAIRTHHGWRHLHGGVFERS